MNSVVEFALRQRALIVIVLLAVFAAGIVAFLKLNIEAYPDPVPPLVDIVTQSSGQSAEEIERYITIPIEVAVAGIPHVQVVRTISTFGLSDVKVQFTYDFTYEEAQQWIINRLAQLPPLPAGATPTISPTSPTGEIYRYRVVGPPGYSVTDLKTIQDWILERRFKAIPGVVDVTGWGGKSKTYDIEVDQNRLNSYGLGLAQVIQVVNASNANVGGQTINIGAQSAVVRGVGLVQSMDDIRKMVLSSNHGAPVLLGDVAKIEVGHMPRLGIAGIDDVEDVVEGIVLMRRGSESTPTIHRVEAEVAGAEQFVGAAARRAPGKDLRPQRPDRRDDAHGAAQHGRRHRPDLPACSGRFSATCARPSSSPSRSRSRWPSPSDCWCCAARAPICCLSERSTSGSSSTPR